MYDDIYSDSKSPILIITTHQINTTQVVVIREMDGRLEWGNDDMRGFPLFYELIQLIKTHVASQSHIRPINYVYQGKLSGTLLIKGLFLS